MKKKKLAALLLCTTMLLAPGASAVKAQEIVPLEEKDTTVTTSAPETNETTETTDSTTTDTEAVAVEDPTVPYDPEVDTEYNFTISASYDNSKEYTAGDPVDITYTITSDADVSLNMSNAYIWHDGTGGLNGTKEPLTDVILRPGQSYTKTITIKIPWDQEYENRIMSYSLHFNTMEFDSAYGYLNIIVTPVTPVIENGEYKFPNAPTRYLINFKLGNGVTGYEPIFGGGGDSREDYHPETQTTDYYLRPGYRSSFGFTFEDKYVDTDANGVSELKDGYELKIKLVDGDCTYIRHEYMPQRIAEFDIKKPSTFEVSVVELKTTISDDSGVAMELPENESENLKLVVSVSDGAEEKEAVSKIVLVDGDKIQTFDLSLLKDGKPYTYNGQFTSTISLPIPEGWDVSQLALYYYDESTGKATPVAFTVNQEKSLIVFETNHFSKYVLAQKAKATDTEETPTPTPTPGGDDDSDPTLKPDETTPTPAPTTPAPSKPDNSNQKLDNVVNTDDASNLMLWSTIAVLAIFGALTVLNTKRRNIK